MARITVEDCEKIVPNRFDLVVLAAQRTRQIVAGEQLTLNNENHEKNTVLALREIAARTVSAEDLKESVIESFRTVVASYDAEEDLDEVPEEDTYNPTASFSVNLIESRSSEKEDKE